MPLDEITKSDCSGCDFRVKKDYTKVPVTWEIDCRIMEDFTITMQVRQTDVP